MYFTIADLGARSRIAAAQGFKARDLRPSSALVAEVAEKSPLEPVAEHVNGGGSSHTRD